MHVVVLGAGPGGLAAVGEALARGDRVTLVDPAPPGGHALFNSLVPSKSLITAAAHHEAVQATGPEAFQRALRQIRERVAWLAAHTAAAVREATLIKTTGFPVVTGDRVGARLPSSDVVWADALVIAVGSVQRPVPGLSPDGRMVLLPRHLATVEGPPEAVTVIGAGPTGLEVASLFAQAGSRVTLFTPHARLLPDFDRAIGDALERRLTDLGVTLQFGTRIVAGDVEAGRGRVRLRAWDGRTHEAAPVFLATGRLPVWGREDLAPLGLATDPAGFFAVDPLTARTSHPRIWAVGDASGRPLLANKARAQGRAAVRDAHGEPPVVTGPFVEVVYTHPEVARVGSTPGLGHVGLDRRHARPGPLGYRLWLDAPHPDASHLLVYTDARRRVVGGEVFGPGAPSVANMLQVAVRHALSLEDWASGGWATPTAEEWIYDLAPESGP
jgi:pyruvate/2-oxoglutarate dehydrogenase complex dihydrolipoamide dehydrogenase (E3) component